MDSSPPPRSHLFNLVIYTHEKVRFEYFEIVAHPFIEKYPCRVIFIQSVENSKFNASCPQIVERTNHHISEKIYITVSKSLLHQIPFILLAKLIPDLPIYLIWGQNPTSDNEILPRLQKMATRFIYDAECASHLQDFSAKILDSIVDLKMDFMDVSWAKISGWRDVLSQAFHDAEKLDYLTHCRKVLIKYNKFDSSYAHHPALQAIFLQGWLAAQLQWTFKSIAYNHSIKILYKSTAEVILEPQERPSLDPGRVFEVEFEGESDLKTTFTLAEKQSKVMVYLSTSEKCELPFSYPITDLSKGLNAMKEVFYYKISTHYINMLHLIKEIPWKTF